MAISAAPRQGQFQQGQSQQAHQQAGVDPRGLRFAAAVTSVVLAVVLVTGSGWLLAAQAVVFMAGAVTLRWSAYGRIFRQFVRPRLGPPAELEAETPPRFAQAVGATFAVIGTVGFLAGAPVVGDIATGFALIAALLNATVGLCLGCELYLTYRRTMSKGASA